MAKLKPSKKTKMPAVLFDTTRILQDTKITKGKYIGDCPKCKLILANFDKKGSIAGICPRCEKIFQVDKLVSRPLGSLSDPVKVDE